jgi:hypothetical protein
MQSDGTCMQSSSSYSGYTSSTTSRPSDYLPIRK